ncbi:hypothetical protein BDR26DRAFT_860559 [Obelidium mucronatum]|nr:hypothetical protein BDR26DRAFT_860559 [Obelidium mucronatum]
MTIRFASMSIPYASVFLLLSGGIAMIIPPKEKVDALLYNQRFYPGQKVKAQFAYERNLSDELNGRNTSTNEEGTFPMLCLHTTLEIEKLKKRMSSKLVTIA